jgi:hypothetical protein
VGSRRRRARSGIERVSQHGGTAGEGVRPAWREALYFQPYFLGIYRVAPKLPFETSYFAYVPLSDAATAQHLLERAKLEYDFARFKLGAGYSAYRFGGEAWRHKPFITGTLKAAMLGNFELWVQRVPDDQVALQIRYAKVFAH